MWDDREVRELFEAVASGTCSPDEASERLRRLTTEDLGFARLDHHRSLRLGFTEVVYCAGKTPAQSALIFERLAARHDRVLATRASAAHREAIRAAVADAQSDDLASVVWIDRANAPRQPGVAVVCAGTADLPVAEEAAITLRLMGHEPERFYDVGVAGLHRLMSVLPAMQSANVLIVVAGMEGALPSVVGGLVSAPVIAVPTSVGYGTGAGGLAALMSMLNSCAPGLAVLNIDNGFGAGCLAARINTLAQGRPAR